MTPAERTPDSRARGKVIEAAALAFLQTQGLRLLARNASFRGGELDLVMLAPGTAGASLVFVEVRYRASATFGGGAASVDLGKRRKLVRAAGLFLLLHPHYANASCRFDVIDAEGDPASPRLRWIQDAFRSDDT